MPCATHVTAAARRGPRVHSNVARPARNVGAGPPRPPSSGRGRFCAVGSRLVPGSQPDWQNSPRQNFFAGVKRGLFRRLAAPRRPLVGRPDSNGLNQARNYVASLRSPGGRAGARSKACHTESLSSVRKHKSLCARESGQETQPRAPLAVASPRTIEIEQRRARSRHGFARARRLTANQQQHQSPWRTRSPPDPPKLL